MDGDDDPDDHRDDPPTGFRTIVVKTGLSKFCRHPALLQQIEAAVENATIIAFEGSKLLNLFFLHLLENKLPIPKLDRNWIVTNVYRSVDRHNHLPTPSRCVELEQVRQQLYLPQRPSKLAWGERDYLGQVLKQLSSDTYINCRNHVAVNFRKRVRQQWFQKLTRKLLHTPLTRGQRWRLSDNLVAATCSGQTSFAMPTNIQLTPPEISYLRNMLAKLRADSGADAARCPINPTQVTDQKLSFQWESYLPWLHRVLIKQYKHIGDGDSKCFTMLPDRGFTKLHIALEGQTIGSFCRQACIPVPPGGFVTKPDAWDQVFELHKVGSQHDKPDTTAAFFPGKSIRTDGVACSVVMHKKGASPPAKKRKRGYDVGPSAVSDIQAHCPSPGDRVVGIDPGKKLDILVGVVMHATSAGEEQVLKVSMKEWRERAGFNKRAQV